MHNLNFEEQCMKRKKKIYGDGDYSICTRCPKKLSCAGADKCGGCGSTVIVAYERRYDVFLCSACLHKFDAEQERGRAGKRN